MVINDKYKFLFYHIPRTRGTFTYWLLKSIEDSRDVTLDDLNDSGLELFHKGSMSLSHASPFGIKEKYKGYTVLCGCRHPLTWWPSFYIVHKYPHTVNTGWEHLIDNPYMGCQSLSQFIDDCAFSISNRLTHLQLQERKVYLLRFEYHLLDFVQFCEDYELLSDQLIDYYCAIQPSNVSPNILLNKEVLQAIKIKDKIYKKEQKLFDEIYNMDTIVWPSYR